MHEGIQPLYYDDSAQLSVILLCPISSANLRLALEYQRKQAASVPMELILVTSSRRHLKLSQEDLEGFCRCKIVEMGLMEDEGSAKATGVRAASAPLLAFIEDHSFPEAGCAEAFIRAHGEGDFAAVGPVMLNANPDSSVSWGCFLVFYGTWMAPQKEVKHLPANHSCYKRDLLLEYGPRLERLLQAESLLHWDLTDRGYKIHQEPAARVRHLNHSCLRPLIHEYFLASRVFAAGRAQDWGRLKKSLFALGSPMLPFIRLRRILQDTKRAKLPARIFLRALRPLMLNLCAGAAGEMLGYALDSGTAKAQLFKFESTRHLKIKSADLQAVSRQ
jgi:hypothetical protein